MDSHSVQVPAALIAGVAALITDGVSAVVTLKARAARAKVERKLTVLRESLDNKAMSAAEDVAYALMRDSEWHLRSCSVIKLHLGAFPGR
jgi:hypothetical protein